MAFPDQPLIMTRKLFPNKNVIARLKPERFTGGGDKPAFPDQFRVQAIVIIEFGRQVAVFSILIHGPISARRHSTAPA